MIVFDYIFYRVAKFFYKKDGMDAHTAIATISLIQGMFILIISITLLISYYNYNGIHKETLYSTNVGKICGWGSGLVILAFNFFRYRKKYWRFADRWKDNETDMQRKIRGYLVVLALLSPWISIGILLTIFGHVG